MRLHTASEADVVIETEKDGRKHRDRVSDLKTSLGDKLMVISLVSQLVNFGVAAVCLQSKEERFQQGLSDTSDEVALFAAVMGLLLVAVQVGGMVYTYRKEKADEKQKHGTKGKRSKKGKGKRQAKDHVIKVDNPLNAGCSTGCSLSLE